MKRVIIVAFIAVGIAVTTGLQVYAQYAEELTVDTTNPAPGERILVEGDGFEPDTTVVVTFGSGSTVLATTTSNADGAISVTVTIPSDVGPGTYTLKATGAAPGGGTKVLAQELTVGGSLSRTGFNVAAWTLAGAGLAAVGLALLRVRGTRIAQR